MQRLQLPSSRHVRGAHPSVRIIADVTKLVLTPISLPIMATSAGKTPPVTIVPVSSNVNHGGVPPGMAGTPSTSDWSGQQPCAGEWLLIWLVTQAVSKAIAIMEWIGARLPALLV